MSEAGTTIGAGTLSVATTGSYRDDVRKASETKKRIRAAGTGRGPSVRLSDAELGAEILAYRTRYAEATRSGVQEVLYWLSAPVPAFGPGRFPVVFEKTEEAFRETVGAALAALPFGPPVALPAAEEPDAKVTTEQEPKQDAPAPISAASAGRPETEASRKGRKAS
jgi:hypothetical protein